MTLNGQNALCHRKDVSFGAHCTNLNEDRPIVSATKMCLSCVSGQKVDTAMLTEAASQPTNLLVTFLEYCSVVSQDIRGDFIISSICPCISTHSVLHIFTLPEHVLRVTFNNASNYRAYGLLAVTPDPSVGKI